jgi:hypothetical protein
MSYWSRGYKPSPSTLLTWKLANLLLNKNCGPVHLVTDKIGAEAFKDLTWGSVDTVLESVPLTLREFWIIGKFYAIQKACAAGRHFLHVDGDVFFWQRPPETAFEAGILMQSPAVLRGSLVELFFKNVPVLPPEAKSQRPATIYAAGIIGGCDLDFWNNYAQKALSLIFEPANQPYWQQHGTGSHWIVEEWRLAACAAQAGKTVTCLFSSPTNALRLGYTHLQSAKHSPKVLARISTRLAKNPPDLKPST